MSRRKEPAIPADLLDQLLAGSDAAAALDQGGLLDTLKKALAERALNAEMDHHLGGEGEAGNRRNGYGRKTVMMDTGQIEIEVPHDRQGSFDPQLIAKYQRRFPGFDDKIISMYARGMSTREITGHRHQILDAAFEAVLPPLNDREYLREWAAPGTASRLRRLANEIARFARNAKRKRSANMESAIADWEDDLHYLHRKYYVGKFGFGWPTTSG